MTLYYNGIPYEFENEGEIETINVETEDDGDDFFMGHQPRESAWESRNVHLFLDECIKKKSDLYDPKVRRRKFFADISKKMEEHGYVFRIETLDRKLRNMKIHYLVSRENNKKSLKRTHWPYYDKMKILYPDATSQKKQVLTTPPSPPQFMESSSSMPIAPSSRTSLSQSPPPKKFKTEPVNGFIPDDDDQPDNTTIQLIDKETLRSKILAFEERRTVASEKILHELKEANRIKRKILEINMQMFKMTKDLE